MNITLLTYGSRGDVQPFLALAVGLQKAGHTPTLAAPARFASLVSNYPVNFQPLAGDPEELSRAFNDAGSNTLRMVMSMRDHVLGIAPQVVRQALVASQNAQLLIHSFAFTVGGHSLARHLQIPDLSLQAFPMFAPTGDYPNVGFPSLGRLGNYLSHWLATQVFWHGGNIGFKQIQHLLPESFPRTLHWPFANPNAQLRTPLLFAISPSVIPPSTDWPANVSVTGYLFLDESAYQPPPALTQFLASGPPPLVVSFGSMVHQKAGQNGQALLQAIQQAGERAVVLTGWGGWRPDSASPNILCLDSAPHSWLFPQAGAVIHHGGAGTTAAGLRAGVPSILIPHAADQPFWGHRIHQLGVGPAPIPIARVNAPRLLAAIQTAKSHQIIRTARALATRIAAEDGVAAIVSKISHLEG